MLNRIVQGGAGKEAVLHIVGKVTTMAAVEEGADRLKRLAGGIRDRGHGQRPSGIGLFVHRAVKSPRRFWVAGIGLVAFMLSSLQVVFRWVYERSTRME